MEVNDFNILFIYVTFYLQLWKLVFNLPSEIGLMALGLYSGTSYAGLGLVEMAISTNPKPTIHRILNCLF